MLYFVTAARGTEDFVIDELNCKCHPSCIHKTDGKVFFEIDSSDSCTTKSLLNLKSVERLFVAALRNPDFRIFSKGGVYHLEKALASVDTWSMCLEIWRSYHPNQPQCVEATAATANTREQSQRNDGVMLEEDKEDEPSKKRKVEEDRELFLPTFRVSCKCSGSAARFFTPQHLSKVVAYQLKTQTGWKVELRKPLFEVMVQINNAGLTVGLPLCDHPLSQRPYLKTMGLRSTLAWILTQLAKIHHGDVVLDPMCGAGTILVEAAIYSPGAIYLGADISDKQLTLAMENVKLAKVCGMVHLFQADVKQLPHVLLHRYIDCIICDVPFGINHSCVKDVKALYPQLIRSMDSVLTSNGRVILLTSTELKDFLLSQVELMNTTRTPSSSHVTETSHIPLSDDAGTTCGNIKNCASQDTRTDLPMSCQSQVTTEGFTSLSSCDSQETNATNDSVHCSLTSCVGKENKLSEICQSSSCAIQDENAVKTPVDISVSSRIVCDNEQLSGYSVAAHMECHSEDNGVHHVEPSHHDIDVNRRTRSRKAPATDVVLPVDRLKSISQEQRSYWQLDSSYYFKLGETHAHACVFQKKST